MCISHTFQKLLHKIKVITMYCRVYNIYKTTANTIKAMRGETEVLLKFCKLGRVI